jgi:uncharacterized membrane protein YhaH (DUF805 family)
MKQNVAWFLLSFHGRINRQMFWLGYLGTSVALLLLLNLAGGIARSLGTPPDATDSGALNWALSLAVLLGGFASLWPLTAILSKRLHDFNFSPMWLVVVPVLVVTSLTTNLVPWNLLCGVVVVLIGLVPGTRGENRFGPDPRDSGSGRNNI